MGMFDEVRIKQDIPDGPRAGSYQTKDFACLMDAYEVDNGRLMFYPWGKNDEPPVDLAYDGMMNIYNNDGPGGVWQEWDLKFTNGALKCAVRVEDRE